MPGLEADADLPGDPGADDTDLVADGRRRVGVGGTGARQARWSTAHTMVLRFPRYP
jgi:hypothetical protein